MRHRSCHKCSGHHERDIEALGQSSPRHAAAGTRTQCPQSAPGCIYKTVSSSQSPATCPAPSVEEREDDPNDPKMRACGVQTWRSGARPTRGLTQRGMLPTGTPKAEPAKLKAKKRTKTLPGDSQCKAECASPPAAACRAAYGSTRPAAPTRCVKGVLSELRAPQRVALAPYANLFPIFHCAAECAAPHACKEEPRSARALMLRGLWWGGAIAIGHAAPVGRAMPIGQAVGSRRVRGQ